MPRPDFTFHHRWALLAPVDAVIAALADVGAYPRWWPQVRSVEQVNDASGAAAIRSLLPMTLRVTMTREIEDRDGGQLRVRLSGDLDGWAQWSISPYGAGTMAIFRQEVSLSARRVWVDRAARAIPVVLRANHAWMMRQGHRGLARELTPHR